MLDYIRRFQKRRQEKKQHASAYEKGQQAGSSIINAVDTFLTPRLSTLSKNVLELYRDRLTTIYDEPEHQPKEVARVELKICLDHLKEFTPKLYEETRAYLSRHDWPDVILQLEATDMVDTYIKQKIDETMLAITTEAMSLTADAIAEAEKR
jgi:hypothetical protein